MASRRKRQSQKNKRNRPGRDDLIARSAAVNPDITANTDPNESLAATLVEATVTPEINPTNTPAPNSISLTTFPTAESLLGEPLYRCQNDPARYVLSQEVSAMELQLEPVLGLGLGFQVPATDGDDGDDEFITGPLDPLSNTTTTTSSLFVPQSLAVEADIQTQAEAGVDIDIDYDGQQQQLSFPASPMDIIMSTAATPPYSSTPDLSALHATATGLRAADPYAEVGITSETRVGGRNSPLRDPSVAAVTAAGRRSTFLYSPFGQVDSRDSSRGTSTAVFQTEPQFQEQDLFGAASASFSASAQAQQQHNDDDDDIIYHATMAASSPIRRGSADNSADIYASMGFVGDLDEHINVHDGIPPLMTTTRRSSSLPPLSSSSSSGKSSSSVSRSGMGRSAAFARQEKGDRLARAPGEYKHRASPTPAIPCPGILHPRTLSQKIRDERPLRPHCKIEFGEQAGQQASAAGINALARGESLDEAREEAEGASQMHIDRMVRAARETDSFLKEFREQGSDYFLNGSEKDENDMDVDVDVDESGNSGTRQWRQRLRKRHSDPDQSDAKSERSLTLTDSLGELSLDSSQEALLAAESSAATAAAAGRASHSRKRTRSQASSSQSGSSMSNSNGDGNGDEGNDDNGGSSRISTNSASTRRTRGRPSKAPKLMPADIERGLVAAGSAGMNDRMSGTTIPASKCMPGATVDFAALGGSCGDRSAKRAKVEPGAMDVDKTFDKGVGQVKETEKKRKRGRPRKIVPDAMEVDASSEKVQRKKKKEEKKKGSTTKTTAKDKKSKTSGEDTRKRHKKEPPPPSSSKSAGSKRKRSLSDPPPEISLSPYLTLPEQTDPSIEPTNGLPLTQDPAPLPSLSPIPENPDTDDPPFDLTSLVWQDEEITGREQDPNYSSDDGFGLDGVGFEPPPARKAELKRKMRESIANYAKREQGAERAARRARRAGQGSESAGGGSGMKGKEEEGGSASACASGSGSGSGEKDGNDGDGSSCGSSGRKRVRFNPMKE